MYYSITDVTIGAHERTHAHYSQNRLKYTYFHWWKTLDR